MPETPADRQPDPLWTYLLARLEEPVAGSVKPADELYHRLCQFRDWFNKTYPDFDLYLEDAWNEKTRGETHLEYILRHPASKDETEPLAADVYLNHQDANGVWHLDAYQSTHILGAGTLSAMAQTMSNFINHYTVE